MRTFLLHAASLLAFTAATLPHAQTPSEIDPMLGADKGGNIFVGPTLPFGMAKPGPDYGNNQGNAGWRATGALNGFSRDEDRDIASELSFIPRRRPAAWPSGGRESCGQG